MPVVNGVSAGSGWTERPGRSALFDPHKKAPAFSPGLGGSQDGDSLDLVASNHGTAKPVVQPREEEVDVLLDIVGDEAVVDVSRAHEQVIVLKAERQVRQDGIFKAHADRSTPAGFVDRISSSPQARRNRGVPVVSDCATALHVKQRAIPSVADLAREQAESIDPGLIGRVEDCQADVAAGEIGPVALRFQAEHPGGHLPAVAELATDRAAGEAMAAFIAGAVVQTPVNGAGPPAAIDTGVETAPVVSSLDDRRRL